MKINKCSLLAIAASVCLLVLPLSGCATGRTNYPVTPRRTVVPGPTVTPGQRTTTPPQGRNIQNAPGSLTGAQRLGTQTPGTNPGTTSDAQRAEKIRTRLESIKGIDRVNVVVSGNTALVGYKTENAGNAGNAGNTGNANMGNANTGNAGNAGKLRNDINNFGNDIRNMGNLGNGRNTPNMGRTGNNANLGNMGRTGTNANLGNMGNVKTDADKVRNAVISSVKKIDPTITNVIATDAGNMMSRIGQLSKDVTNNKPMADIRNGFTRLVQDIKNAMR